jgi:glycosyltransferase involved in cell wall biosynthesis
VRVVHICNLPVPPEHPDFGRLRMHPGRWVLNLALAQKAHADIDPRLVVQVPGASCDYDTEIEGIPVKFVAAPNRFRALTLFQFDAKRLARSALELTPDLIHAHGTEGAYLLAAQATGLPYVLTVQGMFSQINSVMPPRLLSRPWVVEQIERHSLAKAQHVIAKSDYVADWIAKTYPHLEIHRIPNTFDPGILEVPLDMPREQGSIAFVGTVDPRKGLHLLAEAIESSVEGRESRGEECSRQKSEIRNQKSATHHSPRCTRYSPPISLHIFGNHGSGATEYEKSTINKLRVLLGDRLHLHGVVPSAELPREVAKCEVLVAPSIEEMFGNQVIEALLVGTWPVVSSGTAMEENVLRIGAGSIFEKGNPRELAAVLAGIFQNNLDWDRELTREKVNSWIGPAVLTREHAELYESILCQPLP